MKATKKSRRPNVKAHAASNSKVVRSKRSAKKKSEKSNDEILRVATPRDTKLRFLAEMGIVAPDEIPSDEAEGVHLDFTGLGSRTIGAIHSRYAVRHSHAIYHVALRVADLVRLRRDARISEAKFRVRHSGEKKTDVDALMEKNKHIAHVRDRIANLEAEVEILQAVALGYEDLRNAASREMTRRIGEKAATD